MRDFRAETRTGKALLAMLDALPYAELLDELGSPDRVSTTMRAGGAEWSEGDPRPALASDDVAVIQAMARCLTWRALGVPAPKIPALNAGVIHPRACSWCDYPTRELRAAVEWAGAISGLIDTQYATWWGSSGSHYDRSTPAQGTYAHPRWAAFFGSAPSREEAGHIRRGLVERAQYADQPIAISEEAPADAPTGASWFEPGGAT